MSEYLCTRCGYETNHKGTFKRHLERVKQCKPILGDHSKESIYKYNNLHKSKNRQPKVAGWVAEKQPKVAEKQPKVAGWVAGYPNTCVINRVAGKVADKTNNKVKKKISGKIIQNKQSSINIINELNNLKCKYCGKSFNHKQSKYRHEKKRCKKNNANKLNINDEDELIKTKKELQEKNILIQELIQQNLFIKNDKNNRLSYNETNKKFLTDEMISKCMEKQNMCVPEMIKLVHFNNIHPENKNIYISNLKTKYVMVYDGTKWVVKNRDQMLDKIISDNERFMHKKLAKWYDENPNNDKYKRAMKKFQKYLNVNSNTDLIDNIKDELKLMFYNNREKNNKDKNNEVLNEYIITEQK